MTSKPERVKSLLKVRKATPCWLPLTTKSQVPEGSFWAWAPVAARQSTAPLRSQARECFRPVAERLTVFMCNLCWRLLGCPFYLVDERQGQGWSGSLIGLLQSRGLPLSQAP